MTIGYDYSIDNNVFLSAASKEYPYVRQAAQTREEQFDRSNTAGENALQDWWYRSQPSFANGVGMIYLDGTENRSNDRTRARSSLGVDLFNNFGATLLNKMDLRKSYSNPSNLVGDLVSIRNYGIGFVSLDKSTGDATWHIDAGPDVNFYWKLAGDTGILNDITTKGPLYSASPFGVYYLDPNSVPVKVCDTPLLSVTNIEYLKERLVLTRQDPTDSNKTRIFFAPAETTTGAINLDTTTDFGTIFESPINITSIEEGPTGIYISTETSIYFAEVTKELNSPPVLQEFKKIYTAPTGERILTIKEYLNTYLIIGSSMGLRVGLFANDGTIVVGGLTIDVDDSYAVGSTVGIESITIHGKYVYASGWHDPSDTNTDNRGTGIYKVDMSRELDSNKLIFAYQRDAFVPGVNTFRISGKNSLTTFASTNEICFTINNNVYKQSRTTHVDFGWIDTPYIRMDTLEKKWFAKLTVYRRGSGSIAATSIENYGTTNYDLAFSLGTATQITQELSGSSNNPMTEIAYRFKLLKPASENFGIFKGYQIKAQPVEVKQRVIRVPLLCFQREKPLNGRLIERPIHERIQALETIERLGKPVVFQDFITKETLNVFVDNVQFISNALPEDKRVTGYGGVILLTLRTVD